MPEEHELLRYENILKKKLTSANSMYIDGIAFYVVKQNHLGKGSRFFVAYLYPSGHKITYANSKTGLEEYLLGKLDAIKDFMTENNIKGI